MPDSIEMPEALRLLKEARRTRDERRSTPTMPMPPALESQFAQSVRLRTGLRLDQLGALWTNDPQRVLTLVMLLVALGHEQHLVLEREGLARRIVELIRESLDAHTVALAAYQEGGLRPVAMQSGDSWRHPDDSTCRLMLEAAQQASPVTRLGQGAKSAEGVPAVGVPLLVGPDVVGAIYAARLAGEPGFDSDLPYLRTLARLVGWHLLAARTASKLKEDRDAARQRLEAAERERDHLREEFQEIERRGYYRHIEGRNSPAFRPVLRSMLRAATTDATVLILGETGTGKSMVAEAIHHTDHQDNQWRKGPFIEVDLAAIPESIIESELFGHQAGAYTDAKTSAPGLAVQADGGTLFLDEIGELSLTAQKSLLRLVEKKVVRPVGGTKDVRVNLRVIAATNRDLRGLVAKGTFREDLYYRLARLIISLPPLRDRVEDLPLLIDFFFAQARKKHRRSTLRLSSGARARLLAYSWPGNVRELDAEIERLVIGAHGSTVRPDDVAVRSTSGTQTQVTVFQGNFRDATKAFQRDLVRRTVIRCGGNVRAAAATLGMKYDSQLYQVIRRLGLDSKELREEASRIACND